MLFTHPLTSLESNPGLKCTDVIFTGMFQVSLYLKKKKKKKESSFCSTFTIICISGASNLKQGLKLFFEGRVVWLCQTKIDLYKMKNKNALV